MASGVRVRLLIEWYDPNTSHEEGIEILDRAHKVCCQEFPMATLQGYVEPNPPDDEVEHLL